MILPHKQICKTVFGYTLSSHISNTVFQSVTLGDVLNG